MFTNLLFNLGDLLGKMFFVISDIINNSTHILVINANNNEEIIEIKEEELSLDGKIKDKYHTLFYHSIRYIYDDKEEKFINVNLKILEQESLKSFIQKKI